MIYVISKSTCGSYNVRDIQCNANWDCCPYSDYALIPDNLVDGILATKGYCDISLNSDGTEVTSFTARTIPDVPQECCGTNTVLSVNGKKADTAGNVELAASEIGAAPASHNHDGSYLKCYGLNGINIDNTDGNWTVDIAGHSNGTVPADWANVTQTSSGHFFAQIAMEILSSSDTSRKNGKVWHREKYTGQSWSAWSLYYDEGNRNIFGRGTYNTDFNAITEPGWYWTQLSECVNTPLGNHVVGTFGYLEVITPFGNTDVLQRFTDYPTGKTWVRSSVNGWQAWTPYATSYSFSYSNGTLYINI